jgi:hypothetical protein
MAKQIANFLVLAMATTFLLMAAALTGPLAWAGYLWGGMLFVAVIVNWSRVSKN